jgi:hypothetical protein
VQANDITRNEFENAARHPSIVSLPRSFNDPTQETRHPRRFLEETYYWFLCSVPGCNQHYDMAHGYYTIVKGKREEGANKLPCPDCSNRLYLVTRGALNEATIWRCANET